MYEIAKDPFYDVIEKYDRCIIDYCLIGDDLPYEGYASHEKAVSFAMNKYCEGNCDISGAEAVLIDADSLLYVPEVKESAKERLEYDCLWKPDNEGGQIPYWYGFLKPPHGTGSVMENGKTLRREYGREDFEKVNGALFPNGSDKLEVYQWSVDWSDYFDAGHEWWGTGCWSVYDGENCRFVVILVSATD